MPVTRYPYLLFDADNTLFSFDKADERSFRAVCGHAGIPFTPERFARFARCNEAAWARFDRGELTKDETLREQFRTFSDGEGLTLDIESCIRVRLEELGRSTFLMPHALEVVKKLSETHRIFLVTNAVESVQRGRLGRSELAPFIEEAFISEAAGAAKPSTAYFDYVFAHIPGITRENCLVIGDSLTSDIRGANNYDLPCCWYDPKGLPRPADLRIDYVIGDLRELYEIV